MQFSEAKTVNKNSLIGDGELSAKLEQSPRKSKHTLTEMRLSISSLQKMPFC